MQAVVLPGAYENRCVMKGLFDWLESFLHVLLVFFICIGTTTYVCIQLGFRSN